jgi:hypothetical protein
MISGNLQSRLIEGFFANDEYYGRFAGTTEGLAGSARSDGLVQTDRGDR